MYLHVGNGKNIREKNIIGIFDAESSTRSAISKEYLKTAEKRGKVEAAAEELPKSFVLYRTEDGCRVCFSQLSTSALLGRTEKLVND